MYGFIRSKKTSIINPDDIRISVHSISIFQLGVLECSNGRGGVVAKKGHATLYVRHSPHDVVVKKEA